MTPVPLRSHHGRRSAAASRSIALNGGCRLSTWRIGSQRSSSVDGEVGDARPAHLALLRRGRPSRPTTPRPACRCSRRASGTGRGRSPRRRAAAASPRTRAGSRRASGWVAARRRRWSCQTMPHLVNTRGRSETPLRARATTSSEWPRPYTAAVSIQPMPSSRARSDGGDRVAVVLRAPAEGPVAAADGPCAEAELGDGGTAGAEGACGDGGRGHAATLPPGLAAQLLAPQGGGDASAGRRGRGARRGRRPARCRGRDGRATPGG